MLRLLLTLFVLLLIWSLLVKPLLIGAAGLLADIQTCYWWMYPTPPV